MLDSEQAILELKYSLLVIVVFKFEAKTPNSYFAQFICRFLRFPVSKVLLIDGLKQLLQARTLAGLGPPIPLLQYHFRKFWIELFVLRSLFVLQIHRFASVISLWFQSSYEEYYPFQLLLFALELIFFYSRIDFSYY